MDHLESRLDLLQAAVESWNEPTWKEDVVDEDRELRESGMYFLEPGQDSGHYFLAQGNTPLSGGTPRNTEEQDWYGEGGTNLQSTSTAQPQLGAVRNVAQHRMQLQQPMEALSDPGRSGLLARATPSFADHVSVSSQLSQVMNMD